MGAGASVQQSGDDDRTALDLDTFAKVRDEYRRLSCRERDTDDGDDAAAAPPALSDEEVFTHLKHVVAQRLEQQRQHPTESPREDEAATREATSDDDGDAVPSSHAQDTPAEKDATLHSDAKHAREDLDGDAAPPAGDEDKHADDKETSFQEEDATPPHDDAKQSEGRGSESVEDDPAAALLQQPLTSEALRALADTIPIDAADDDDTHAGLVAPAMAVRTVASLSGSSFGRSVAVLSSSSNSSHSTFDLTQNLTPVFTTDVLTDPTTLKMITSYAEAEGVAHGSDWIKFWVEIDALAQLPSHSYTHRRLRKIYDKFLSPEAPSPVCVTSAMLTDIEAALQGDSISAGIYVDAQQVCLTALEQSVFPRFRENRLFKKMVEFCAPPTASSAKLMQQQLQQQQQQQQLDGDATDFSLPGILAHPAKLRFLKTYCMEALALENLLFYLEVEDCKRLPNLSFIVNKTRKIYDRYCTKSSRNCLELPDAALAELHAAAEAKQPLFPKLFYEAQLLVFERISDEIWKGFCRTSEYLEYSRRLKPERRRLPNGRNATKFTPEQSEQLQKKLDAMNEFQLIETAMHYSVAKLIPTKGPDGAAAPADSHQQSPVFTPAEQLTILLGDSYGKKFFKQFMAKRGIDQFLAFCGEVEDFKLLPGIEFLQHTAKKIYRKYILPSAKMQVDMSRAMRDEIGQRLLHPSIDMFKKISQRVRQGMLQDSLPRFVKAPFYHELKKLARQFKEAAVEADLKAIDAAAKKGKLELGHLDLLLQNQLCMKQFRLFLESQHCAENLMLWEEIEHFRRLPSYQIVLRSAKKLYDKYLNPNNTRNALIPVSEALRARVLEQLEAASRTTFDEVENECFEVMRSVVVPDFLDSRIFMALVGTWATVDDEYPAEMLKGEFEMAFLRHRFHLVQEARGLSRDTSTPKAMLTTPT